MVRDKKLTILYKIHTFTGGAPRSLLAFANIMKRKGHTVIAMGEDGPVKAAWEKAGIRVLDSVKYNRKHPLRKYLNELKTRSFIKLNSVDLVHAATIDEAFFLRPLIKKPILLTIAGGEGPDEGSLLLNDLPIVAFSKECIDELKKNFPDYSGPIVLRKERLEIDKIDELGKEAYDIPQTLGTVILHTSRLDNEKVESVVYSIEAYCKLIQRGVRATLLILGGGVRAAEIENLAKERNTANDNCRIITIGSLKNPFPIYKKADIILGMGRSVWEGMVFGKPAIVVGRNGSAGIVSPENYKEHIEFNFAGRNLPIRVPPEKLADELSELVEDPSLMDNYGKFSSKLVRKEYDVNSISDDLEDMYYEVSEKRITGMEKTRIAFLSLLKYVEVTVRWLKNKSLTKSAKVTEK